MCFSATVSFITAAGLVGIGILTLKMVKEKNELLLASIPVLFGLQQMIEGLNWLNLTHWHSFSLGISFSLTYLFFAMVLWPMIIPLGIYWVERSAAHKKRLFLFVLLGIFTGLSSLFYAAISQASYKLQIVDHSIFYRLNMPLYHTYAFYLLYLLPTVGACLASSTRLLKILGIILFTSALITYHVWYTTFISVWCFFAAILSMNLYVYFKNRTKERLSWKEWFQQKWH